jgi:hypothetical protein
MVVQIIIKAIQMFCSFGGPYIAPFIYPGLGLLIPGPMFILWPILLLSFFMPLMLSSANFLNSDDDQNINGGKAFLNAFAIYYLIMIIVACVVMQSTCNVVDQGMSLKGFGGIGKFLKR